MELLLSLGAIIGPIVAIGLVLVGIFVAIMLRRVVPTNEVHIVQSSKKTVSYGREHPEAGNTYYQWPSWVPKLGVEVVKLPVSVFDQDLTDYEAYDQGRLPFMLDVKAFFRISDSTLAAQRVASFEELRTQLKAILQGAVRTILASVDIEQIMQGRSEFGQKFTTEVNEQLQSWGVTTVKSIELMDIRDSKSSQVIANIMEKKKSMIEKESRIEVAANKKEAQLAEINASREVDMRKQEALQLVGIRTAEQEQQVGVAKEQSKQVVQEQAVVTAEKQAAVKRVENVKAAEIAKDVAVVQAEQEARTKIIESEAAATTQVVLAEAGLKETRLHAEGVQAEGLAIAEAEKAKQMAPIAAQIALAQEIGGNPGYQTYLVQVEQVKANQQVGIAQAAALEKAHIKVIATGGNVSEGVKGIGGLLGSSGGANMGAMVEAFANTDAGKAVLSKLGVNLSE